MCESDEGNKYLNNEFILTEVLKTVVKAVEIVCGTYKQLTWKP